MFDQVSVLIPYQSDGNGPRDSAFEWVLGYYAHTMPEIELCIGELSVSSEEPFSRSKAINQAYRQATRDIIVIADSDIAYDPHLLKESITHVDNRQWVIPFSRILRLSEEVTELVLQHARDWPLTVNIDLAVEQASAFVGGFNVLNRKAYETVGGYDERFIGWGGEDEAFAYALDTLIGQHVRLDGEMVHFWHPFVGPGGNPHYDSNFALYERYKKARGQIPAMLNLIREQTSQ